MRKTVIVTVACLGVVGLALADQARALMRQPTEIPAQKLAPALAALAKDRKFQVLYRTELVGNTQTAGASGNLTLDEAMHALLDGTGLSYRFIDESTVKILSLDEASREDQRPATNAEGKVGVSPIRRSYGDRLRLSQAEPAPATESSQRGADRLEEIVVTAQKREERLHDVPVPVTAINGEALANSNQLRLQDFYTRIPGLSVTAGPSSTFNQQIVIRGITTGAFTNPTVGVTVDDVPFGSSTDLGGGNITPDLDPSDLARIEVLRGPQGTLYGASSMGGLIKYVTVDPSTDAFGGRVQVGTRSIRNGDSLGYDARGSFNIPLSDTLAVRAGGFTRQDPGYIDSPTLGREGINESRTSGGRLAALWKPSDDFSLKFSAMYERVDADGANQVATASGALEQNFAPGIGPNDGTVQAYSATLTGKLGNVDLTSLSGYNIRKAVHSLDFTAAFGSFAQDLFNVGGVSQITDIDTSKFTQEIRLSAPIGEKIEWLLGGIYTDEDSEFRQDDYAIDLGSGRSVAHVYESRLPMSYAEYAAFADVTFRLTDRFDVQVGGRKSTIRQTFQQTTTNSLTTGGPTVTTIGATQRAKTQPFTYLLTPRFKLSPTLMLYARLASGYRAGGPNGSECVTRGFPCQFEPDKTRNYEIGAKGEFLDRTLSLDASIYRIDWKNIQLYAVDPDSFQSYNTNASEAKSQGIELAVEARPMTGLSVAAWVVWNEAELTEAFPLAVVTGGAYGAPGDRLPYSSRFSGNVAVDRSFPLGEWTGFVGATMSYVGNRKGAFTPAASVPRVDLPGYARTDLNLGVRHDSWTANLFANNVFDKRALIDGGTDLFPPAYLYIQPRTVGVSVARTF